jgi:NADPH:quinone reductase-like Zn-dependent oxidoreductase
MSSIHPHTVDLSINVNPIEVQAFITIISKEVDISIVSTNDFNASSKLDVVIPSSEYELAIRGTKCYVHRLLQQTRSSDLHPWLQRCPVTSIYALACPSPRELILEERTNSILSDNQVEVRIATGGVTEHDVHVWNSGAGVDGGNNRRLGLEFAGVVNRIGCNVKNIKVGDKVFGVGTECCASYVTVDSSLVSLAPSWLSFDQLGSLGVDFVCAYYGLVHLGHIRKGDYVLICLATSGFGLFSLYLTKYFGGIPICTADAAFKIRYLNLVGVEHVLDSNSATLADDVLSITDGKGINIFLNTSGKETALELGSVVAAKRGRVINIMNNTNIPKSNIKSVALNVTFSNVDLIQLILDEDPIVGDILAECGKLIRSKAVPVPPVRVFTLSDVNDAYLYMEASRHIGKLVVGPIAESFSSCASPVRHALCPLSGQGSYVREDGTYFVTGGTQGFTLELAKGLLDRCVVYCVIVFCVVFTIYY